MILVLTIEAELLGISALCVTPVAFVQAIFGCWAGSRTYTLAICWGAVVLFLMIVAASFTR